VISIEDNTTKISTDNAAITSGNKTAPIICTVAPASRPIAAGHYVTVTLTLGGTTPIVPALSTIEIEGYEG
jgi:phosphohistidine swiveling domain-containing protein